MKEGAHIKPYEETTFFADHMTARPLVEGTVPRNVPGQVLSGPPPITMKLLERGRERFNIYCSVCHGQTGEGNGMIVQRGYVKPPSYHIDRLRKAPIRYFYDVMTQGFGAMPDYAEQIPVADRWAIAAYIRALQLSQDVPVSDLTQEEKKYLNTTIAETPGGETSARSLGNGKEASIGNTKI